MPKTHVLDGTTVREASKVYVLDGTTVREAKKIYALDGTTVREVYSGFTPFTIQYLVVGGGGGGGTGGGGGGGGYQTGTQYISASGFSQAVTVGVGGTAGINGTNGGSSSFNGTTAIGGGKGGNHSSVGPNQDDINGNDGASGGGGGCYVWPLLSSGNSIGQVRSYTQGIGGGSAIGGGNAGGNGSAAYILAISLGRIRDIYCGGGGGGSSTAGTSGVTSYNGSYNGNVSGGDGGNGTMWLDGLTYGGGGRAVAITLKPTNTGTVTLGVAGSNTGAFGAGGQGSESLPGAGGSGGVIIRYPDTYGQQGQGGTVTQTGGYYYHTFSEDGTFSA